jgi:hypothetical protein
MIRSTLGQKWIGITPSLVPKPPVKRLRVLLREQHIAAQARRQSGAN